MKKDWQKIWLSPGVLLFAMSIGALVGIWDKPLAAKIAPWGSFYLSLLQMCVLPLLITAAISGIGRLFKSGLAGVYLGRIFLIFISMVTFSALLGIVAMYYFHPGAHLSTATRALLGTALSHSTEFAQMGADSFPITDGMSFMRIIVPVNIFAAISQGQILPVLFFCFLLGCALGKIQSRQTQAFLSVCNASYEALLKMVSWILFLLPVGLFCLFASYIANLGLQFLMPLSNVLIIFYGLTIAITLAAIFIIWRCVGGTFGQIIQVIKTPLVVAFCTSSSLATLPITLRAMQRLLPEQRYIVEAVLPLGINFNSPSSALRFAVIGVFVAQLYGISSGFHQALIVLFTSLVAASTVSGLPGAATAGMIALVLGPLGLPAAAGIMLTLSIQALIDPFLTLANVSSNCLATVLAAERQQKAVFN